MGQKQTRYLYSPLEFVEYKKIHSNILLENFLKVNVESQLNLPINSKRLPCIDKLAHKIRCISEGWEILPKIEFELLELNDVTIPRVVKIIQGA